MTDSATPQPSTTSTVVSWQQFLDLWFQGVPKYATEPLTQQQYDGYFNRLYGQQDNAWTTEVQRCGPATLKALLADPTLQREWETTSDDSRIAACVLYDQMLDFRDKGAATSAKLDEQVAMNQNALRAIQPLLEHGIDRYSRPWQVAVILPLLWCESLETNRLAVKLATQYDLEPYLTIAKEHIQVRPRHRPMA